MPHSRLIIAIILAPLGLFLHRPGLAQEEAAVPIVLKQGNVLLETEVSPEYATIAEALASLGIPAKRSLIIPGPQTPLQPNIRISILPEYKITIKDGTNSPREVETFSENVGSVVASSGIILSPLDRVSLPSSTPVYNGLNVKVIRVIEEERQETVSMPFSTIVKEDPELPFGQEHVVQKGTAGKAEEVVRLISENGRVTTRTIISRKVLGEPSSEIRTRGTKITVGQTIEGLASWYRFKRGDFAASTKFPRGTWLRVTHLQNGKQVIVRVNDYGPSAPGRIIDLDAVAFAKLEALQRGVTPVRVEEIR